VYKRVERIDVYIWGEFVGATAFDPSLEFYVFSYDKKFLRKGIELAPLFMPRSSIPYVFPDLPELTYKRLPALLSDSLPDDFGNALVDRYMAEKGIPKSQITSLDRLAYMGKRAMGALEFKPAKGPHIHKPTALEMSILIEEARKAVHGSVENDTDANAVFKHIIEVGTSAGGARAKAVIAWNPKTQEVLSGLWPDRICLLPDGPRCGNPYGPLSSPSRKWPLPFYDKTL
jgi:serine/threonine-protein kinase HipA